MKIYKSIVPIFEKAKIESDAKITEGRLHAIEIVQNADLSTVDGIICVGGDGIVNECATGLLSRTDTESIITRIPLGHIPAGTGHFFILILRLLCY